MRKLPIFTFLAATAIAACFACASSETSQNDTPAPLHEECNSMYYWRTVFKLDSTERQFLSAHNVDRLYIRMFDVVDEEVLDEEVTPNATIVFDDSVPASHVVPTVYITVDALRAVGRSEAGHEEWARKILTRVMNMCSYNDLPGVEELQVDCDWTESTRESFFDFCRALKAVMQERTDTKDMALSSTIRLHQLRQSPPPVDRGALMVYNTGSFLNPDEGNSILSYDDVAPYLSGLKDYPLHLDFAYPIYSWGLLYRNNRFMGLLHESTVSSQSTKKLSNGNLEVLEWRDVDGGYVWRGDIIRLENSKYATILKVKTAIDETAGTDHSTILYHLSTDNIKKYTDEEIEQIYK